MARNPARRALPKRFRPLYDQAFAQAELQYGASGDLLAQLLGDAGDDYARSVKQARRGARLIESGIDRGRDQLSENLMMSGLSGATLAEGGSPDARRIQQTQQSALDELSLREQQAQEGAQSMVRQAGEAYRDDAGKIRSQLTRLLSDRGTYTASLLDELIEGDRNARREARQAARDQQFEAEQKALDRSTDLQQSIIGQNIDPATGKILNPRKDRKSSTSSPSKPKLTTNQINAGIDAITNARGAYQQFSGQPGFNPSGLRNGLRVGSLPTGDKPIKIPKVTSDIYITAGFELAKNGRLSQKTQAELKRRGLRIPKSWRWQNNKTEQGIKDGTIKGPPAPGA